MCKARGRLEHKPPAHKSPSPHAHDGRHTTQQCDAHQTHKEQEGWPNKEGAVYPHKVRGCEGGGGTGVAYLGRWRGRGGEGGEETAAVGTETKVLPFMSRRREERAGRGKKIEEVKE